MPPERSGSKLAANFLEKPAIRCDGWTLDEARRPVIASACEGIATVEMVVSPLGVQVVAGSNPVAPSF
jgi:hypothetical protein